MWVRSQDKDKLVNVNSFEIDKFVKDGNYIYDVSEKQFLNNDYYIYSSETGIIGIYKSRERALEVLNEIQAYLENNYLSINDMPQHNNNPWIDYCPRYITRTTKTVYQMPKE